MQTMILMDMTVKDFTAELASASPAPGGGTIAAVNGAFAAGLGAMACAVSLKKAEAEEAAHLQPAAKVLLEAKDLLLQLADDDTEAFNVVMAAFKLPKDTDEQMAARKKAIAAANVGATEVPMQTAGAAVGVCEALEQVVRFANPNVMSDCGVAVECAKTAALGAFMNVAINLPGVKDEKIAGEFRTKLDALKKKLDFHYASATAVLKERFEY